LVRPPGRAARPAAPREDYFETLADAARREAMGEDDWTAFFLRHDTFWVDGAQ